MILFLGMRISDLYMYMYDIVILTDSLNYTELTLNHSKKRTFSHQRKNKITYYSS